MARKDNTNESGGAWSPNQINAVWQKGAQIEGYSPGIWRRDKCGRAIKYSEHGNRQSQYGWEIDHIVAVDNGGTDSLNNLQPLNWENNVAKSNKKNWSCP